MSRVLITTIPFGVNNSLPIELLKNTGIRFTINPLNRKLTEDELAQMIGNHEVIIAGTEPITEKVMECAKNLKFISRVGVGLDNVDLSSAYRRNIPVSYTPDAPAPAVAELTVGMMLTMLRHMHLANNDMHHGNWHRYFGRRITDVTIGIIGAGRIGTKVLNILSSFGKLKLLVNDLSPRHFDYCADIKWVEKEVIYREADLVTLHLPLSNQTKNMIRYDQLKKMKQDAILINTSRGGIVNEADLARVLNEGHLLGAAIDVFEQEPYAGELRDIDHCYLTSHMGSMTVDCRSRMEIEATQEAIRFLANKPLLSLVPKEEYDVQLEGV